MEKRQIFNICLSVSVLSFIFLFLVHLSEAQEGKLSVGILPIVDSLPFFVAEKEGFFNSQDLKVDLVFFPSALERDVALQAGKIDSCINDMVGSPLLKTQGQEISIVSIILGATPQEGPFAILSSPDSGIKKAEDLKNVPIGVSSNTIIDYVTDILLKEAGLKNEEIKKTEIKSIPLRFQMLMEGKVKAATLPDPLLSLAHLQGAHLVLDDTKTNISQSVLIFKNDVIEKRGELLKKFAVAYNKAVELINGNPEQWRTLLVEKARLPEPIKNSYKVPAFPKIQLPTKADTERVLQWMKEKGLIDRPVTYENLMSDVLVKGNP